MHFLRLASRVRIFYLLLCVEGTKLINNFDRYIVL